VKTATEISETELAQRSSQSRRERYERLAKLLQTWKGDESGYDDEVWPLVEEELQELRIRLRE